MTSVGDPDHAALSYDRHGAEQLLGTGPHLGVTPMRMPRCMKCAGVGKPPAADHRGSSLFERACDLLSGLSGRA
jgi:hypothetical protein